MMGMSVKEVSHGFFKRVFKHFFFFKDIYKGINHKTWVLVTKYGFK